MIRKRANWKAPVLAGGAGLLGGISTYAIARALGLGKGWSTALAIPGGIFTGVKTRNLAEAIVNDRKKAVEDELAAANRGRGGLLKSYSRLATKATHGPTITPEEWKTIGDYLNDQPEILKRLQALYDWKEDMYKRGMGADSTGVYEGGTDINSKPKVQYEFN